MADILRDPRLTRDLPSIDGPDADLGAHQRSYRRFGKIVTFAALHIASVLAALAVIFLGDAPVFGMVAGLGVNLALLVTFAVTD